MKIEISIQIGVRDEECLCVETTSTLLTKQQIPKWQ